MATIVRGTHDVYVDRLKAALDDYERENPGAVAEVFRQNAGSVWVRITDERFAKMSKSARHDELWDFLAARMDDDTLQELSVLLPVSPSERRSLLMSAEFDDPMPTGY